MIPNIRKPARQCSRGAARKCRKAEPVAHFMKEHDKKVCPICGCCVVQAIVPTVARRVTARVDAYVKGRVDIRVSGLQIGPCLFVRQRYMMPSPGNRGPREIANTS